MAAYAEARTEAATTLSRHGTSHQWGPETLDVAAILVKPTLLVAPGA